MSLIPQPASKPFQGIGQNTITNLTSKVITSGLAVATNVLIARQLGPAGQGIYSSTVLIWTLGIIVTGFGIGITNTVLASQRDRTWTVPALLSNSLVFVAMSVLLSAAAIGAIELGLVTPRIGELTTADIRMGLALVPLGVMVAALGGLMCGLNRLREWNVVFVLLGPLVSFVVLLTLVAGPGFGVAGAIGALMCGQASIAILGGWRFVSTDHVRLTWSPALLKESIWYGLRVNLAQLVGTLNFRLDTLLVLYLLGARDAGLYAVALFAAEWLFFIPTSISVALFPRLGMSVPAAATDLTNRGLRLTLAMSLTAVLGLALAARLVLWMFGEAYAAALSTFLVLLPGVGIYALAHILTVYWYGHARMPHVNLAMALLSLMVDVAGVLVLVPRLGLTGAALASTLAYTVTMVVFVVLYIRHTGTTLRSAFVVSRADLTYLIRHFPMFGERQTLARTEAL